MIMNRELTENRTARTPRHTAMQGSAGRAELLAMAQGAYYAATGVWALADIESFQVVTGPKADQWLVKTVGVLVTAIGGALALAGWRRRVTPEIRLLAVSSALGLAGIDIYYVQGENCADLPGRRRRGAGGGRRVGCLGARAP